MKRYYVVLCGFALGCSAPSSPEKKAPVAAEKPAPNVAPKKAEPKPDPVAKPELPHSLKGRDGVAFTNLRDGQTIVTGYKAIFALKGKAISPAGSHLDDEGLGHHHLIIDGKPIAKGVPVPADATHLHFGKGQTEHVLDLTPGQHTLTLQFADGAHRSYGPDWATSVSVVVTAAAGAP